MNETPTILVVEDEPAILSITVSILKAAGYQVLTATNGAAGVELARRQRPDLVLMDVNMPGINGIDACQQIKEDPELAAVYVILISGGRVDTDSKTHGLVDGGADGYLTRPMPNRELLAHIRSILRLRQAEVSARDNERQLNELIEANVDGMLVIDDQDRAIFANPAACDLLNRSRDELIDQIVGLPLGGDSPAELNLVRPDGRRRIVERRVRRIAWQQQMVSLASLRDVTARKEAEDELQRLNKRLEEQVVLRNQELTTVQERLVRQDRLAMLGQWAGSVGHELRNPLAIINNAVYYLRLILKDADPEVDSYLHLIDNEVLTASRIISNLLSFAHISTAQQERVPIARLVQHALQRHPPPAKVTIEIDLDEELPPVVVDSQQIDQILGNLLKNAYEAIDKQGTVRVTALPGPESGQVTIAVQDSGRGIAAEELDKIFEPLYSTKSSGIGLGLAICQGLAEANQGKLAVESEIGKGAIFRLSLPAAKRKRQ